eukprot:ctg_3746.g644
MLFGSLTRRVWPLAVILAVLCVFAGVRALPFAGQGQRDLRWVPVTTSPAPSPSPLAVESKAYVTEEQCVQRKRVCPTGTAQPVRAAVAGRWGRDGAAATLANRWFSTATQGSTDGAAQCSWVCKYENVTLCAASALRNCRARMRARSLARLSPSRRLRACRLQGLMDVPDCVGAHTDANGGRDGRANGNADDYGDAAGDGYRPEDEDADADEDADDEDSNSHQDAAADEQEPAPAADE